MLTESLVWTAWRKQLFPFLAWTPLVNRETLQADCWAAVTGALVVLPQGVAFATIAGMPPEYGLYAAIVPTIIAALFGSSWHLVAGPSTTASLVLFSALSTFAEPGSDHYVKLAMTLAFMVGLLELSLGVFKLGAIVNFISHSVIIGFTAGVGVLIIITQTRNFAGLSIPPGTPIYETVWDLLTRAGDINIPTTVVGLATLGTGIAVRRYFPRIPFMVVAILVGSLLGTVFNLLGAHVATVGALPSHLPHLSSPSFDPKTWVLLLPTALALGISALNELVSISRAVAIRSGQHVDANQEFIGQGLANTIGSFFSGYVVSSSFNRSALNYAVGARTPLSAILAGVLLIGVISVAASLAAYLPYAAMGASLYLIGWGLVDRGNIAQIARTSRTETVILIATFLAALFIQVQFAILAGVTLSLIVYLYRTSKPQIHIRVPDPQNFSRKFTDTRPDLPECKQIRLIRIDGSLFFGAVNSFKETLLNYEATAPLSKHLLIVMQGVNFIDVAGAEALAHMAGRYKARGGRIYLIRPKESVLELLERGSYMDEIGPQNVFFSKTTALRTVYRHLDYDICRSCSLRVYVECVRMGKQEPLEDDEDEKPAIPPVTRESMSSAESEDARPEGER